MQRLTNCLELKSVCRKFVAAKSNKIEDEFGDVLFSMINYARFLGINPEDALERTNKKFIHRFKKMEEMASKAGKCLSDMSFEEMDKLWEDAKSISN